MVSAFVAIGLKTHWIASIAAASPPTISVIVPFSAAAAPPEMPASMYCTPRCLNSALSRIVELAAAVLRSITVCPARHEARMPPAPSTTASTTLLSGNDSSTTSANWITSAIDAAARAPAANARSGTASKPSTSMPAPTRRRVMRPPILPKPMKPMRCVFMSLYQSSKIDVLRFRSHQRADRTNHAADAQQDHRRKPQRHECAQPVHIFRLKRRDDHREAEAHAKSGGTN